MDGSETALNTCTMNGNHSYSLHLPACASNVKTTLKVFSQAETRPAVAVQQKSRRKECMRQNCFADHDIISVHFMYSTFKDKSLSKCQFVILMLFVDSNAINVTLLQEIGFLWAIPLSFGFLSLTQ